MSKSTRSPIKDKPLRAPGQSLQEQWQKLVDDKLEPALLLALFMVLLAGLEWWREYTSMKPSPWMFTAAAIGFVAYAALRIFAMRRQLRALKQGIEGERAVGQFLERLREQGYQVFHDVQGTAFNVDHVLIGPAGVLTVETKTWSKPIRGDARIQFDGQTLTVHGMAPDRDVVAQTAAQASWLKRLLAESTGRTFEVRPVVVFPGWFIESAPGSLKTLWVLEPKALPKFLANEPRRLETEDIHLAAFHLSRYIRAGERDRQA